MTFSTSLRLGEAPAVGLELQVGVGFRLSRRRERGVIIRPECVHRQNCQTSETSSLPRYVRSRELGKPGRIEGGS